MGDGRWEMGDGRWEMGTGGAAGTGGIADRQIADRQMGVFVVAS
jgi:hypothetical protein